MAIRIKRVEVGFQPRPGAFNRDVLDWNELTAKRRGCTSGQEDPDGLGHAATAEGRHRPASAQQRLVNVVMKNVAEPALVLAAQIARKRLGKGIADGVRMAGAFALDDFHLIAGRERRQYEITHRRTVSDRHAWCDAPPSSVATPIQTVRGCKPTPRPSQARPI